MPLLIDGKKVAADLRSDIAARIADQPAYNRITPGLALLLVGSNPASEVYVGSKGKACAEVGIKSWIVRLPETATEKEVLDQVKMWNEDPQVHGILVQLPLPKHINEANVILAVSSAKDVDGFHPESVGRLVIGLPGFVPCTPAGIMTLIERYSFETSGKHVVVVGRSNIVGKPIANLLLQKRDFANAVVTICHTGSKEISHFTRQADILVSAVGVHGIIRAGDVKEGAVVFDVGINRIADPSTKSGTRLVGDVDFESVAPKCAAITPVPGGIGPMTIAMLLNNTLLSAFGEVFV